MTEELYLNGERVDLDPGTKVTLNFKSNLLSDISKITASNSQTIRLPKTTHNRGVLDNPSAIAYFSDCRYKRFKARYIRNGIEVVRAAYAVLLSSAESYEIAVYWGVMSNFQAWIDRGAKLNELEGAESLTWSKNFSTARLSVIQSQGYGYASYDCGVENANLIKIHPSATAWWILGKIATQAGFTIDVPERYQEALKLLAIPCLGRKSSLESWEGGALKGTLRTSITAIPYMGVSFSYYIGVAVSQVFQSAIPFYKGEYDWATSGAGSAVQIRSSWFSTCGCKQLRIVIRINTLPSIIANGAKMAVAVRSSGSEFFTRKYSWMATPGDSWSYNVDEIIDCSEFDEFEIRHEAPGFYNEDQGGRIFDGIVEIYPQDETITYPSVFGVTPNLPEVTQVDFIKAVCGMLGVFAVPDPLNINNLKFVSLEVLQQNKGVALDWSDKLVCGNDDEPKSVEFKINDYCRHNLFKYKQDDTVATNGDGDLRLDSEVLGKEKTVITLPFAASDGNKIPHYKLSSDGTSVVSVDVKERVMRLSANIAGYAQLTFDQLDFSTLLSEYYPVFTRMLNEAIAITERLRLDEIDLKTLDFACPFYLRQYGRYYGIISIQTSGEDLCEVKAVQLPSTMQSEIVKVDIYLNYRAEVGRVVVAASTAVASDINISYSGLLSGLETAMHGSARISAGGRSVTITVPNDFYNFSMSITPTSDDKYNYIISA